VPIDEHRFVSEQVLQGWCDRIGGEGFRGTGTAAHERIIGWVEAELAAIPGLTIRVERDEVRRWQPVPGGDPIRSGSLRVGGETVLVAGAVPYTQPTAQRGPIVRLQPGEPITAANAAGKVVLRDFPSLPLPYDLLLGLGLHVTPDAAELRGAVWDRPGLADGVLHEDLLAAGVAGAAGVVFAFDLPRDQIAGYFEPHKGTHYRVPGVFVGVEERDHLRGLAEAGAEVEVGVQAEVATVPTRNVYATLPGRSSERAVLVTHTDGNTWVQENGIAALLGLGRYFAETPIEQRGRTIELAFTTAHLHISREGAARYAAELDADYDDGGVAFAFPIEHLGARELVPVSDDDGPGRRLEFTGGSEPVLWAVGPSDPMRQAVIEAVTRRQLERVLVAPGLSGPVPGHVPEVLSFGGLGTYFNMHLVPTTSIITAPWSLWAPAFGASAIDVAVLRRQVLAAGDVVVALDAVPRDAIAGGYLADRAARAAGAPVNIEVATPEVAPLAEGRDR
jgi:hypothetical protein